MQSNVMRLPPRLPVAKIANAVDALIALLDEVAGDPDLELNGDENEDDGTAEDDDFDIAVDDEPCDEREEGI